jgi:hypothetical protein
VGTKRRKPAERDHHAAGERQLDRHQVDRAGRDRHPAAHRVLDQPHSDDGGQHHREASPGERDQADREDHHLEVHQVGRAQPEGRIADHDRGDRGAQRAAAGDGEEQGHAQAQAVRPHPPRRRRGQPSRVGRRNLNVVSA